MYRIALMVFRLFFKAPYYIYHIWKCGRKKDHQRGFEWCKYATIRANRAGRVTIESYGIENIPKENGFIMFPNHQGLYDILAFLESCPAPFACITKKEARNIILLKQVGDALGTLMIDREDIRQSMQVIQTMAAQVKEGKNFIIFAEGTRSRQGNKPIEFKGGSFKSAVKAKCPIVPCALLDSFKPFDEKSIKPVTVKVIYLPPMLYDEYKDMKTTEIAAEVRRRIEAVIAEYEG